MRRLTILLAVASLSACHQNSAEKVAAAPAALSFEGATGDAAAVRAHGERLSHILGCRGCHGPALEGKLFNDDAPDMGKIYASNLTRAIPTMSDAQLRHLLRDGVHPTRGDLWIMPSEVFQRLSEPDLAALIAHLRTVPPSGVPTPPPVLSAKAEAEVASGKLRPATSYVAEFRAKTPPDLGPRHALGRYLVSATCSECHGADLTGVSDLEPGVSTPDLDIAGTYDDADLARLLSTGKGRTARDLGLMTLVGKGHFAYLTPHERSAIIAYVKARAAR